MSGRRGFGLFGRLQYLLPVGEPVGAVDRLGEEPESCLEEEPFAEVDGGGVAGRDVGGALHGDVAAVVRKRAAVAFHA